MKKINLDIDLKDIELNESDKKRTASELCMLVVSNIMLTYASRSQGFKEDDRRIYYKIQDTFDKALKDGATEVDLEDAEMEFLRKCKRECLLIPNKLLQRVEELIDAVKDR